MGRDLLIGCATGTGLIALGLLAPYAGARLGIATVSTLVAPEMLLSVTDLPTTLCSLAYSASICVLTALQILVLVLVLRLLLRRTSIAVAVGWVGATLLFAPSLVPDYGWPVAIIQTAAQTAVSLVIMRFGVLAGTVALFVTILLNTAVPSLDLSAWYADRAFVPILALAAIVTYGAFTALAGKSIWGDPLKEPSR